MLTEKQKEHLKDLESLGFNIRRLGYDDLITELIHKYVETSSACDWSNEERFRYEFNRVAKTMTN